MRREWVAHQRGKVDRPQQAGAVGRKRLLAAWIGGADLLAVGEVVHRVDAIDEDHARLGKGVGRTHDPIPQRARAHGAVHGALERQRPGLVALDGRHERVGDQHRQIEIAQPPRVGLGIDEGFDVGMIAAHRRHHGAAPLAGRHDGPAHGIPYVHEADRPRRSGPDAPDERTRRPQRREVVPDAPAFLHRQGSFLDVVEDRGEIVADRTHDEAVEERDVSLRPGARNDATGREELEICKRVEKALLPRLAGARFLDAGAGCRKARPGVRDVGFQRRPVRRFEAIFRVPHEAGNRRHFGSFCRHAHGAPPLRNRQYI